ncbi:hypothetical protein AD945_00870 [Gluconobacter albidus]|uniref:Uncharacterized protein n=1 Tax=Gluconobacter albidus TaxID=318683 RepID=A0A149TNG0_9PROT|nr:hypothetical protein [Gluconobacter albidus]KXV51008.1 hypothetical protein AD945_00870 [Gluconobacter albidus]
MTQSPSPLDTRPKHLKGPRLSLALFRIGWSERQAAEKCDMHRTQLRRCLEGTSALPSDLSGWLLDLEAAHLAHPCPRQRRADPILAEIRKAG